MAAQRPAENPNSLFCASDPADPLCRAPLAFASGHTAEHCGVRSLRLFTVRRERNVRLDLGKLVTFVVQRQECALGGASFLRGRIVKTVRRVLSQEDSSGP